MIALLNLILMAINIYSFILIASILMSWLPNAKESSIGQMLSRITDPYLDIFRRFIPPLGMIDFSPIVAIFALNLASRGIVVLFSYFV
ncbi:YggT family protein [Planococcus shenhongbingii]|uniref:YggT family protein n=1 Tax=Planococcus shenhongbingii TaxID=3058398 RepID=A0ABT8N8P9_9BACL|nr:MULTISPECIES: YggT family protein [unclassified Planococcus (in: firmicutes)]MDN7244262.1 YggT family protein [Planococcus sp. N017]WKA57431.1 YggT family protein [Planococcus sp. N016]